MNSQSIQLQPIRESTHQTRIRKGITYLYDSTTRRFLNPITNKWVVDPSNNNRHIECKKRIYYHPDVSPILERIAKDENQYQSLSYVLRAMVMKCQLRAHTYREYGRWSLLNQDKYCWFRFEFYARLLGFDKYKTMMSELVKHDILNEFTVRTIAGAFPTYKLTDNRFLSNYQWIPVTLKRVADKIDNYHKWAFGQYDEQDRILVNHVIENFQDIDIEKAAFLDLWGKRYEKKYLPRHPDPNDRSSFEEYMMSGEDCWKIIENWKQADDLERLRWINPKDSFGHRFHHIFTYLPSELRPYVCDRNRNPIHLTEYDTINSQPGILANQLVSDSLKQKDSTLRQERFIRLIENREIYEDLAEKTKTTRDAAKVELLTYMYCMATSNSQKRFEQYYGIPAIIVRKIKEQEYDDTGCYIPFNERHKALPRKMQRLESKMYKSVWHHLIRSGLKVLPVHDASYVVDVRKSRIMRKVIEKKLKEFMLIKFKVKYKQVVRQI